MADQTMHDKNGELNCGECQHYHWEMGLEDPDEDCLAGRIDLLLHGEPGVHCPMFAPRTEGGAT